MEDVQRAILGMLGPPAPHRSSGAIPTKPGPRSGCGMMAGVRDGPASLRPDVRRQAVDQWLVRGLLIALLLAVVVIVVVVAWWSKERSERRDAEPGGPRPRRASDASECCGSWREGLELERPRT